MTISFVLSFIAGILPMYARITALSGNPFFPFLGSSSWHFAPPANTASVTRALRLFWDITFARDLVNQQPPFTPLFAVAMLITIIAARKDRRAAFLAALCAVYIAIFITFM